MKTIHTLLLTGALAAATVTALPAQAQTAPARSQAGKSVAHDSKAADLSEGEVRKVDQASRKIILKHGPLKNLDMPPMTMAFQVTDPAMLDKVKVGDKVRFVAANPGGKLTVTQIQAVR